MNKRKWGRYAPKGTKIMSREERLRARPRFELPWRIQRNVIIEEDLQEDPWWFTVHRRGLRRPLVGEDPLEARAVSKESVYGSLPERILYRRLTQLRIYFDFQSSLQGGRMELGGMVADFILPDHMYVLRVQGPTHQGPDRFRKDEEQRLILEAMGYTVFDVEDKIIYDEYAFEDWIRRLFGLGGTLTGGASGAVPNMETQQEAGQDMTLDSIWGDLQIMRDIFERWRL